MKKLCFNLSLILLMLGYPFAPCLAAEAFESVTADNEKATIRFAFGSGEEGQVATLGGVEVKEWQEGLNIVKMMDANNKIFYRKIMK